MADALIGIPAPMNAVADATALVTIDNVTNDEPGLIYKTAAIANAGTKNIDINLFGTENFDMLTILGLPPTVTFTFTVKSYPTSTDRTNGTNATTVVTNAPMLFSSARSAAFGKFFLLFGVSHGNKFWRITVTNTSGASNSFQCWRILFCTKFQPADNIDEGPVYLVDDRSERHFTRTGRRVIDPTIICPGMSAQWSWMAASELAALRRLIMTKAGSYPMMFVLDPADTTNGEDHIFYGDFEKDLQVAYNNYDDNVFKFSIVSIDP